MENKEPEKFYNVEFNADGSAKIKYRGVHGDYPILVDEQYIVANLDTIGKNLADLNRLITESFEENIIVEEMNTAIVSLMAALNKMQKSAIDRQEQ